MTSTTATTTRPAVDNNSNNNTITMAETPQARWSTQGQTAQSNAACPRTLWARTQGATRTARCTPNTTRTATNTTRTAQNCNAEATTTTQMEQKETTSTFIVAPFLCDPIFANKSANPLKLILLAKEAATFFDTSHQGIAQFNNVSAKDHTTAFSIWAFAIHLGQLSKVSHTLMPNDAEMQSFYDKRHCTCIHSPLLHAPANTTDQGENLEVFNHLSKGLKQMGKAAEQLNTL
jgi:hypothetical protein